MSKERSKQRAAAAATDNRRYPRGAYGPEGGSVDAFNEEDTVYHLDYLLGKLQDQDFDRRRKAAEAIAAYVGDALEILPKAMDPHPAAVLTEAIEAPRVPKGKILDGIRALGVMGKHAAPYASAAVARHVRTGDYDIKFNGLRTLNYMGPGSAEAAGGAVAEALAECEEPLLRYEAARTLFSMGRDTPPVACKALADAVDLEQDTDTKFAAIKALGAIGPSAARVGAPPLERKLRDRDTPIVLKRMAVQALGEMGEAAAKVASGALGDMLRPTPGSDPQVRRLAAVSLQAMGRKVIFEQEMLLARALGDRDDGVREAAREALKSAGHEHALQGAMALAEYRADAGAGAGGLPPPTGLGSDSDTEGTAVALSGGGPAPETAGGQGESPHEPAATPGAPPAALVQPAGS